MDRLFLMVCILCLFVPQAHAEMDRGLDLASRDFQESLGHLKQSVEKLQQSNGQLKEQNGSLEHSVRQMASRLDDVTQQEEKLVQMQAKMQEVSSQKAEVIKKLESQVFDLQSRLEVTKGEQTVKKEEAVQRKKRDDELRQRIAELTAQANQEQDAAPVFNNPVPDAAAQQRERMKIAGLIEDSQARQARLSQQVMAARKRPGPVIAADPYIEGGGLNGDESRRMTAEINALQKNYEQLSDLFRQIQKKIQSGPLKATEENEKRRIEASTYDLNKESANLRADLDGLRAQLVELDKRKSYLEKVLK